MITSLQIPGILTIAYILGGVTTNMFVPHVILHIRQETAWIHLMTLHSSEHTVRQYSRRGQTGKGVQFIVLVGDSGHKLLVAIGL